MDKNKKEQLILLIVVVSLVIILSSLLSKKKQVSFSVPANDIAAVDATSREMVSEENIVSPDISEKSPDVSSIAVNPVVTSDDTKSPFDIPSELTENMTADNKVIDLGNDLAEGPNFPKINLEGIVWGSDSPIAFIDGKVYKKGDAVGDAKIIDIDKKGIYLLYNGEKVLVRMKKQI